MFTTAPTYDEKIEQFGRLPTLIICNESWENLKFRILTKHIPKLRVGVQWGRILSREFAISLFTLPKNWSRKDLQGMFHHTRRTFFQRIVFFGDFYETKYCILELNPFKMRLGEREKISLGNFLDILHRNTDYNVNVHRNLTETKVLIFRRLEKSCKI